MAEEDISITVGIPSQGLCDIWFAYSLAMLELPPQSKYQLVMQVGGFIDANRNRIVDRAQGDYILFLDDDVLPPHDIIMQLLKHNKDIVSGLYFNRQMPYHPQAFTKVAGTENRYDSLQEYGKGLIEVDGIGMGVCLIKKSVFEKLEKPFFQTILNQETGNRSLGEDLYFCKKVKEGGFKIFVDTDVQCLHIGQQLVGADHWEASKEKLDYIKSQMSREQFEELKKTWRDPD